MSNFSFPQTKTEYALFAPACIEARENLPSAPAMCAVGCRKALELAVKWGLFRGQHHEDALSGQPAIPHPRAHLSLCVDYNTWGKLPLCGQAGHLAVTYRSGVCRKATSSFSPESLFEFIQWIDYCYGAYEEHTFDEQAVPLSSDCGTFRKSGTESLLAEKIRDRAAAKQDRGPFRPVYGGEADQTRPQRHLAARDLSEYAPPAKRILTWISK